MVKYRRDSSILITFSEMAHQTQKLFEKYFGSWLKIGILAGVLAAALIFFYISKEALTTAEVADYFPSTCLGSWQTTEQAQGEPETLRFSEKEIGFDNAAYLDIPQGEIYCGQFLAGDKADLGEIKGVGLTLVWRVANLPKVVLPEATVSPESTSTPTSTDNNSSVLEGELQGAEGVEGVQPNEEVSPPSSWNRFFSPLVLAQESEPMLVETPIEMPANTSVAEPVISPETSKVEPTESEIRSNAEPTGGNGEKTDSQTEGKKSGEEEIQTGYNELTPPLGPLEEPVTELIFNPTSEADESFLRVSYSLDGQVWREIGKINATNWLHFTAPLNISSWEDLRKVQFKVEGIPTTLENFPEVYLDGMFLEVQYEKPPIVEILEQDTVIQEEPIMDVELPADLPVIVVPEGDGLKPAPTDRKDFTPNEAPSFDMDFENLPGGNGSSGGGTSRAGPEDVNMELGIRNYEGRFGEKVGQGGVGNYGKKVEKIGVQKNSAFSLLRPGFFLGRFFLSLEDFRLVDSALAQNEVGSRVAVLSKSNPVIAQVVDADGKPTGIAPTILTVNDKLRVNVPEPRRSLKPGAYKLKVWVLRDNKVYFSETDFTWGVFAINFNKSIYKSGDTVNVGMAVLDEEGHTLCDAQVSLRVVLPSGAERNLSTRDGSVIYSDTCGPDNVTQEADYKASFAVEATGTYKVLATTRTENGLSDFEDKFEVQEEPTFDVSRSGPTRIYPPAEYKVSIMIVPKEDFNGFVKETVPKDFRVVANMSVEEIVSGEDKVLSWSLDLKAGEAQEISYLFKAPNISPEFYKLGPLGFYENADDTRPIFSEIRSWQIAADAVQNDGSAMVYGDAANDSTSTVRYISVTSTVGSAVTTVAVGAGTTNDAEIKHVSLKAAPTRAEFISGQLLANGRLDFIKANGTTWTQLFNVTSSPTQVCNGTLGLCYQSFDVAYEQLSGRALMVYNKLNSNNGTFYYVTWDGNVTSSESSFIVNASGNSNFNWMKLIPKGSRLTDNRSNEMMLLAVDNSSNLYAAYWDGTQFLASTTLKASFPTIEGRPFDGAWETLSGDFVAIYGSTTATTQDVFARRIFSGSAWGNETSTFPMGDGTGPVKPYWVSADADPLSNRIAAAFGYTCCFSIVQTDSEGVWKYDGVSQSWSAAPSYNASMEGNTAYGQVQAAFERFGTSDSTSTAIFTFNPGAAADTADYAVWTPGGGFPASVDFPGGWEDDGNYRKLIPHPNNDYMVFFGVDSDNDLNDQYWDGSSWNATGTELSTSVATTTDGNATLMENNAFDFAWQPYSPWSLNWRWYDGTSTADTPTPALANENTSTSLSGTTDKLRLRFNVAERSGNSQTDARKKLQWTSSTTPDASSTVWTDVGNIGSSTIWRYFDPDTGSAVGNDGTVVSATVLTSSTVAGWWNTSKNAAANSNMDHASTSIRELEFPVEANTPDTGNTYYFRMYDVDQGSPVYRQQTSWPSTPCASGQACKYPSVLAPAAVPVSAVSLNGGNAITLLPNTTTTVYVNFTVSDSNGCSDVFVSGNVTTTIYRSGVLGTCSLNDQNCYRVSTSTHNCSAGSSANGTSTFEVQYFAQATDGSSAFPSQYWEALVETRDGSNNTSSATSTGVDVNGLLAIELVTSTINYGSLNPTSTTGAANKIVSVKNVGNSSSTIQVSGTALKFGSNTIATSSQHYASSSFVFGGSEGELSNTATTISGLTLVPNTTSTNSIAAWTDTTALPSAHAEIASAVYNGYLYVLGGVAFNPGIQLTSTVRYAPISSDGTIGAWGATTALPEAGVNYSAATYVDKIYVVFSGGSSTVMYAPINTNGTIGSWINTSALPSAVGNMRKSFTIYEGYLYVAGFSNSSTVYYAKLNTDGSVGAWSSTTALPDGRAVGLVLASNGFLYHIAGKNSGGVADNDVYYAPINSDGTIGAWGSTTVFPAAGYDHDGAASGGYLYVTGGEMAGNSTSTVYYAKQEADGTIAAWNRATSLSASTNEHASVIYNGYLYVLGGFRNVGSTATSSVFYSPVNNGNSQRDTFWGLGLSEYVPTGTYMGSTTFLGVFSP